jgi:hypothetical protein
MSDAHSFLRQLEPDEIIKDYLKNNLKIELEYCSPVGLNDGFIKATIKLDGEIIDSDKKTIVKTLF